MKDFVKYDLALKLKEKGFITTEPFAMYQLEDIDTIYPLYTSDQYYYVLDDFDEYSFIAPTISQVLNWLFDKKQLFISLDCNECDHFGLFFTIYKKDEETWVNCGFNDDYYNTPEEAAIGAIEYILNNLI